LDHGAILISSDWRYAQTDPKNTMTNPDPLTSLVKAAVISALEESGAKRLPRLMTQDQAGEYLGVEPAAVGRLRHYGKLKSVRISERVFRFDVADLDAYVEANK
jgi:excisionase family DNA binding protein